MQLAVVVNKASGPLLLHDNYVGKAEGWWCDMSKDSEGLYRPICIHDEQVGHMVNRLVTWLAGGCMVNRLATWLTGWSHG